MDTKHETIVEDFSKSEALELSEAKESGVGSVSGIVDPDGNFSIVFSDDLMGLIYLLPLDATVKTQGRVSELYADEEDDLKSESNLDSDDL